MSERYPYPTKRGNCALKLCRVDLVSGRSTILRRNVGKNRRLRLKIIANNPQTVAKCLQDTCFHCLCLEISH